MVAHFVEAGRERILSDVKGDATTWRFGLFKSNTTITDATVYADLTQADYSGYARQTPAFGADTINGDGDAQSVITDMTFQHNGGGTPNTIYGWFLVDSFDDTLLFAERLAAPRTMGASGDQIVLSPTMVVGDLA